MANRPKAARKKAAHANAPSEATIRFYCQGIGDCHLLTFTKDDGDPFRMLIDCGIHTSISGGPQKIDEIVADLRQACDDKLDVIVGTHEHWDHTSGFYSAQEAFAEIEVGEVWLGWTEDPDDDQARKLDTYKGQALAALQMAEARLTALNGAAPDDPGAKRLEAVRSGIGELMGFQFGLKGEKTRATRDALTSLADDIRYLEPGKKPITIPGLPNLRIYVMGPPRDEALIGVRLRKSEMYGATGGWPVAAALAGAFEGKHLGLDDRASPFEPDVGADLEDMLEADIGHKGAEDQRIAQLLRQHYVEPAKRRIDSDWLGVSADLAIQLDDRTNNSSVVLAFEFIDTGRIMLFVADAQVGNWLSWETLKWKIDGETVTGHDLLARTVFYKVGHHGSENATLKAKGLELMTDKDLSAFIPTNEKDAKKVKWGEMPFHLILDALKKRAGKRVIRADDAWVGQATAKPGFRTPSGSIQKLRHQQDLWVEMDIA